MEDSEVTNVPRHHHFENAVDLPFDQSHTIACTSPPTHADEAGIRWRSPAAPAGMSTAFSGVHLLAKPAKEP
jgi:hypothetical protein